jgi:hypothetical protein
MGFHPEIVEVWHTFDLDGRYQLPDSRSQMWDSVSVTPRISRCGTFLGSHSKKVRGVADLPGAESLRTRGVAHLREAESRRSRSVTHLVATDFQFCSNVGRSEYGDEFARRQTDGREL